MRVISNSGSRYKSVFSPEVDVDTGRINLVETATIDLYEQIQSYKDSVDLHSLINRYRNGEYDVFNQRQGFYADVTDAPKTYAELYDIMIKAQNSFNSLPVDVRKEFDFDFGVYLSKLGSIVPGSDDVKNDIAGSDVSKNDSEVKSE